MDFCVFQLILEYFVTITSSKSFLKFYFTKYPFKQLSWFHETICIDSEWMVVYINKPHNGVHITGSEHMTSLKLVYFLDQQEVFYHLSEINPLLISLHPITSYY